MLNNRTYIGEAVHKGDSYPGEHDAIVERDVWDKVHAILTESPRKRAARTRADTPALLKGLLYGPDGAAFSPTQTRKGDKLDRYYVSQTVLKHGAGSCPVGRVPAGEIVAGMWKAARTHADDVTEVNTREALQKLDPLWDELFPAEQARIVALLVERADINTGGLNVRLRVDGHFLPRAHGGSDDPEYGIILRADLHRLFDAGLLDLDSGGLTTISEVITDQDYQKLHEETAQCGANLGFLTARAARPES